MTIDGPIIHRRSATSVDATTGEAPSGHAPLLQIWFGNFFEPWLTNRGRVTAALREIRDLGFNAINLDSKSWEDFFERARGGAASAYVGMQEFMMAEAHRLGLGHSFLAVYFCGDNLYPHLRDAAPVRGEDAIGPSGQSLGTYKYWSQQAQQTMLEHVAGLMRLYRDGHARLQGGLPVHTMFDPMLKPSFDAEGRERYLGWLEQRYRGDISGLNRRYGTHAADFRQLAAADYWLKPDELQQSSCGYPGEADFAAHSPDLWRWIDNQTWLAEETENFFRAMKTRYRTLDPSLVLFPVLAQWGMFFPPPGNIWWDTALRAIDPYRIAPHVDCAFFIAAPINPENDPDPHALSAEFSIQRNSNDGRPFVAGLFLGRHVHGDLYRFVSPAEAIGTAAAHGAAGLHAYGYGGADDGGVLQHMDDAFKQSLQTGNHWAARVLPLVSGRARLREAAILFPRATQLFEPTMLEAGRRHRMDLLGWYRQLVDLGFNVDILHPDQIKAGGAAGYRLLILPTDACYEFARDADLEHALAEWVRAGGVCFHGPGNLLAQSSLGIEEATTSFDCIRLADGRLMIPHGWSTVAFPAARSLAPYHLSGVPAIGETLFGRGRVLSVGFPYGFAYATKTRPVPHGYHREETVGVQLLDDQPVLRELLALRPDRWCGGRGVETGWFEGAVVVVNHRNTPVTPPIGSHAIWQVEAGGMLIPHTAVYLEFPPDQKQ